MSLRAISCAFGASLALCVAPTPAAADGVYFVKQGDTLYRISRVFGVDAESIRELNALVGSDIKPGDRLRIPEQAIQSSFAPEGAAPQRPVPSAAAVRQILCREETVYHRVAKGETLTAISRRYATTIDALRELNRLPPGARLSIGQKLLVRRTGPRAHTVRRGDTLGEIAARFGTTPEELRRLNGLAGDRIAPGQRLQLESCEQFELASASAPAPPALGPAAASDELMTALAEATAMAAVEARDRADATLAVAGQGPAAPAPSGITQRVINLAKTMLDIPYRFGGTSTRGIDCSAYVQRVFALLDVTLPRTAREQFKLGEHVQRGELSVGDLVFFRTYASFPSHVGIYLGDDLFIHASSVARKVTIDSLGERYYTRRFLGGRRLPALSVGGEDFASSR